MEELTENIDIFTVDIDDCGRTDIVYHRVDTGDL
jgi:hypothetical protein